MINFNNYINNKISSEVDTINILCKNWDVDVTVAAFYYVVKFMKDCHG